METTTLQQIWSHWLLTGYGNRAKITVLLRLVNEPVKALYQPNNLGKTGWEMPLRCVLLN